MVEQNTGNFNDSHKNTISTALAGHKFMCRNLNSDSCKQAKRTSFINSCKYGQKSKPGSHWSSGMFVVIKKCMLVLGHTACSSLVSELITGSCLEVCSHRWFHGKESKLSHSRISFEYALPDSLLWSHQRKIILTSLTVTQIRGKQFIVICHWVQVPSSGMSKVFCEFLMYYRNICVHDVCICASLVVYVH